MSRLFSRALVEEYSEASPSGGALSAQLSATPMPRAYCSPDRMTGFSRLSRSGMTFAPLTEDLGEELLKSYRADFPVRTSPQQDEVPESPERKAGSGWKWRESSVKYDPDSCLWKTRQCSLFEDSEWFSETWPRWGLMRDGECWELPMSARHIFVRGSGLWATIRAADGERVGRGDLIQAVQGNQNRHFATPTAKANQLSPSMSKWPGCRELWPTPVARDDGKTPEAHMRMKANMKGGARHKPTSLTVMVKGCEMGLWQTPVADDSVDRVNGKFNSRGEPKLSAQVKMFPTPNATDGKGPSVRSTGKERPACDDDLPTRIARWPTPHGFSKDGKSNGPSGNELGRAVNFATPTKSDGMGGPGSSDRSGGDNLRTQIGGSLNPDWVEWLMGWPVGWTSLEPMDCAVMREWDQEPAHIPRVAKGVANRVGRLKAIGNGQVPQCAALAWRVLTYTE